MHDLVTVIFLDKNLKRLGEMKRLQRVRLSNFKSIWNRGAFISKDLEPFVVLNRWIESTGLPRSP